jgi:hypothetical protein
MDIIHCPVFDLKHSISDTEYCLRLQVNLFSWDQETQLFSVSGNQQDRLALFIGPNWEISSRRLGQNPVSETSCFKWKTGRWIMSRTVTVILIYRRHKHVADINRLGS